MVKWIIVHTNSDNGCMEFKLFYGTEIEVRQLLKSMAVKSDIITNFTEKWIKTKPIFMKKFQI